MARKVEADVEINDQSSKGLAGFLAGLRKADDAAKKTQRGIDETTKSTSKLSKETEANAKAFQKLSKELEVSKKELGGLAKAFADAGTAAERTDITKAMRKQQTEIRNLTKNHDILKDLLPDDQEIQQETESFGKKLSKNFEGIGDLAGPALAIGIAASAPAIGAVISGAVVGGIGAAGVIGGLALAAKDPQVEAQAKGFAQRFGSRLTDSVKPFVPVAIDAIHQVEQAAGRINLEGLFSDAAKEAGPLISGLVRGVESLADGITDVIHNAGPEVKAIGDGIAGIGDAIGDGLSELADNGKQGADALRNVFSIVDAGTRITFGLVNALTEVYGTFRQIAGPGVVDALTALTGLGQGGKLTAVQLHGAGAEAQFATNSIDQFGQKILTSGDAIATFTSRVDALASSGRSLFDSTTQVGEAIDNVTAAAKKNGKTLDQNTEKGRNNRAALSDLAGALVSNYDAYVQVNGEGIKSNGVAASNRAQFIKLATQLGATKARAAELATQMGLIPAKKNSDFTLNTHDAAGRAAAARDAINSIKSRTVNVTVAYSYKTFGKPRTSISPGDFFGFDATNHFAFAGAGGGTHRTGGPLPVDQFSADVTSNLYLDGTLVYSNTARQVKAATKRAAWRQKVGRR